MLSVFVTLKALVCIPVITLNLEFTVYGKWCNNYLRSCWTEEQTVIMNSCLLRTSKLFLPARLILPQKGGGSRKIQATLHNTTVIE